MLLDTRSSTHMIKVTHTQMHIGKEEDEGGRKEEGGRERREVGIGEEMRRGGG
jgi:hypothetical protein